MDFTSTADQHNHLTEGATCWDVGSGNYEIFDFSIHENVKVAKLVRRVGKYE